MTITAQSIVRRATDLLQDQTSVRWPVSELVRYLNDAQRMIIKVRPDAMNTTTTMTLVAGSRQDLDNAPLVPLPSKLIEITRNMAAGSAKRAVTKLETRRVLDAQTPGWHAIPGTVDILHYLFDPRDPKTFYVYPPALAAAQLEVMYSAYPIDIAEPADGALYTAVIGNISLPDIFADEILDLMLARAYSKDSENGDAARAQAYKASAVASLGAEIQATLAVSPKTGA